MPDFLRRFYGRLTDKRAGNATDFWVLLISYLDLNSSLASDNHLLSDEQKTFWNRSAESERERQRERKRGDGDKWGNRCLLNSAAAADSLQVSNQPGQSRDEAGRKRRQEGRNGRKAGSQAEAGKCSRPAGRSLPSCLCLLCLLRPASASGPLFALPVALPCLAFAIW